MSCWFDCEFVCIMFLCIWLVVVLCWLCKFLWFWFIVVCSFLELAVFPVSSTLRFGLLLCVILIVGLRCFPFIV